MRQPLILVVDDEHSIREFLTILLEQQGHRVATAENVASALEQLSARPFDLVMCDLRLPDGNGLDVLRQARHRQIEVPFIIITAHTTPQHAMDALRAGAAEYLSKPFNVEDLKQVVAKLLNAVGEKPKAPEITEFIGTSPSMKRIMEMVPRVAATPSTVLITGDSGTGKELLAQAIHARTPRANGPLLSVNCGALPEGLLESELFGHMRGSFTGAVRDHDGLFAQANGGAIFLDEVGELTPAIQVKLLRVLQERRVRPVGGSREVVVDVRVMAATNRDLHAAVKEGLFREDLFYRLNVIHLQLPPLRRRQEDIPILARHFVVRTCERFAIPAKRLSPDTVRVLQAHSWPGNIRELENVIERTVALESTDMISSGSLPELMGAVDDSQPQHFSLPEHGIDLEEYLNSVRRNLMLQALEQAEGSQKAAAELLRLSYRAFRYHADKLGLVREEES